jgi:hypothetical protein
MKAFDNLHEARRAWAQDQTMHAQRGVHMPEVRSYLFEAAKYDYTLALDALPSMTTMPNAAIPAMLATIVDPDVLEITFQPNKAAEILGERSKGSWIDDAIMFQTVEHVGEVSSYGDFNNNGHTGANTNWPYRQQYVFQTIKIYGDREAERYGLARLDWASELQKAAATVMNKFLNLTYLFGVAGLQNYGLMNDPGLLASISPSTKANGGARWMTVGGLPNATANEVYADITGLFTRLVVQSNSNIDENAKLVLVMDPVSSVALKTTNSFGISVKDLLAKNFPGMRFENVPQFATGAGNVVYLIAENVNGVETGYAAFSEKMRAFPLVRGLSHYEQKLMGGSWGAILRQPWAVASMIGV